MFGTATVTQNFLQTQEFKSISIKIDLQAQCFHALIKQSHHF
jgi:hypothetical protein